MTNEYALKKIEPLMLTGSEPIGTRVFDRLSGWSEITDIDGDIIFVTAETTGDIISVSRLGYEWGDHLLPRVVKGVE